MKGASLGGLELMVLLATMRLGNDAYGVTIRGAVKEATGRDVATASVYFALERLQDRGLLTSRLGEPTAERGGRAKRYFRVTPSGVRDLRHAQQSLMTLWAGLPELVGGQS